MEKSRRSGTGDGHGAEQGVGAGRLQETRGSMAETEMEKISSHKYQIDVNRNIYEEPDVDPQSGWLGQAQVPDEDPRRTFQAASLKKTN